MYQVVAIDLGATSGRVMLACFESATQQLTLQQVHRFANQLVERGGQLCWDIEHLEDEIFTALNMLVAKGELINSIGIDSWGVDFVCLDKHGNRLGEAVSYRDDRTQTISRKLCDKLGFDRLYRQTGIQFQPFNTLFQLSALTQAVPSWLDDVDKILMIPDYFHYRLTGQFHWDYTNATTTGMLGCRDGNWQAALVQAAGASASWFGQPVKPGTKIGDWQANGSQRIAVMASPTHDTAAAIAAAPLMSDSTAYISSGTWSLIGIESEQPLTNPVAKGANLTNEGGANGRFRVLKNVMGMWLIEGILKHFPELDICQLCELAAQKTGFISLVNPNDSCFIHPDSMVAAIQNYCQQTGQRVPQSPGALVRCVLDSLALSYRQCLGQLEKASGQPLTEIRIVGGGSQNQLLNQLCADICQRPVLTGPVEASALGNVGYQLIGLGAITDGQALRQIIAHSFSEHSFSPRPNAELAAAIQRFNQLDLLPVNHSQSQIKEYV
ncbi:rhamnulokinase [Celerinatantimonas diazotrophica]|uniref:Rhamnulokinase n=1 Tax=Celerinatantimonas diazotrophica TaxID=412034 RepID=A0A4R1JNV6_9GAMM|nr:rhamnulokinase [Celerinatantimonas diazotrophica]TCK52199.1 L-rhamnulokinase [Celerinatantimonas diazotrophica]CAG9296096.1 L-Rhamnulokinase [Celerinatantimonas diazotrophica]